MNQDEWPRLYEAACKRLIDARDNAHRLLMDLSKPGAYPALLERTQAYELAEKLAEQEWSEVRKLIDAYPD